MGYIPNYWSKPSMLKKMMAVLAFVAGTSAIAHAQCTGAGGIPFNCAAAGASVGATDLILGGKTSASNTVKFTGLQAATGIFAMIPTFSGGGTTNFLRADGTWAVPPSGSGSTSPGGSSGQIQFNSAGAFGGLSVVPANQGGTGVNNGSNTITTSLPFVITGSGQQTFNFGNSGVPWTYNFPQATAALAYQVGAWTSGNCLQASGTAGGIAVSGSACGSGGGSVTWPASTDLVISNGTSTPAGLAPVNGDCVVASGGAWTAGSCGTGSGGSTVITLAPGLTSTPGTQNTGTQSVTNGSTLSLQAIAKLEASNYTLDTSSTCVDIGAVLTANGSASVTLTLPNPGSSCGLAGTAYSFADATGHGYTLASAGGSATFNGLGAAATSFAVPAYGSTFCTSDGASKWICQGGTLVTTTGGSGTPGGSSGQVQFNNGGAFGGLTNAQLTADINTFTPSLPGVVPASGGGSTNFLRADGSWAAPAGSGGGTVNSVGLSMPSDFSVANTPVTSTGTLTVNRIAQAANTFQAAPNGSSGTPAFRTIQTADMASQVGMEIDLFYNGVPPNNAVLAKAFSRATTIAANAPIKCVAITSATSSTTITLAKVSGGSSTNVGTLVFGASGSTCTVTFSSSVSFAAGDMLKEVFPATADTTLANVAISIPAVQ